MSDFTIIELNTIDSTNNYAMQLIDANKAHNGLTITTQTQTGGKGQRGKSWVDKPGQSLLMSIILLPERDIRTQFVFNSAIAVAIAKVLQKLWEGWQIHIKWPNDIIINDKKAGGILIENVLRGNNWTHSIVGIGLNVKQDHFAEDLPFASSLKIQSGEDFDVNVIRDGIWHSIIAQIGLPEAAVMEAYNALLYRRGRKQQFSDQSGSWNAIIIGSNTDGTIELQKEDDTTAFYQHGQVLWVWE